MVMSHRSDGYLTPPGPPKKFKGKPISKALAPSILHDFLITQVQAQPFNVALQVIDLAASDDWEDVRCLLHDIG